MQNIKNNKITEEKILHLNDLFIIISPRTSLLKESKFHSGISIDYDYLESQNKMYKSNKYSFVKKDLYNKVSEITSFLKSKRLTNNLCVILNDLNYRISIEKNLNDLKQQIDRSKRINEEFEFGKFIAKFGAGEIEISEIQFKAINKGKSEKFLIKSESFILSVMRAILSTKNISDWDKYNNDLGDDYIPSIYKSDKMVDFIIYAYCLSLLIEIEKIDRTMSKYKKYYIAGRLFAAIDLLDNENEFNKKNHLLKYSYTSYYKYLTDNLKNIETRIPKLFNDADKESVK